MIYRNITESLLNSFNHFPVLGIIGPRQVGKTTLAKSIIPQIKSECIYLDLEKPSDLNVLREPELYLKMHENKCVILDEIQRIPEIFPVLRALIDENRENGRFMILGSTSPVLIRKSSETLAGRIIYKELYPFNLLEGNLKYDIVTHWFRGGFPNSFLEIDDQHCKEWLDAFITTYIERDFPMLGLSLSPILLRRFWTMLAHYHGGQWNASSFAQSLGISSATVSRYTDFLEEAFIIRRLFPFSANVKKRLIRTPKIYIRDSGLLHRLTGINSFEDLQHNVLIGHSWEGYVIEQIKHIVPSDIHLYYYRTRSGSECDLVFVKSNQPIATVEIKYSSAPDLSKGHLTAINDLGTTKNYIIAFVSEIYPIKKDIIVCNLQNFMEKYLSEISG